jgi:hypothetical protein
VASENLQALREQFRAAGANERKLFEPGIDAWLRYHQRRLPRERRRFLEWRERWHAGPEAGFREMVEEK